MMVPAPKKLSKGKEPHAHVKRTCRAGETKMESWLFFVALVFVALVYFSVFAALVYFFFFVALVFVALVYFFFFVAF